jgi:hypothetical protein
MAREARLALADQRALEEQEARTNPLNPIRGGGATPSMGLSQFRGGKKSKKVVCEDSSSDEEMSEAYGQGRHLYAHLHGLHGSGYADDFRAGMSGGSRTGATEGQGTRMEHHHDSDEEFHGGAFVPHYKDEQSAVNVSAQQRRKGRSMGGKKEKRPLMESDGRLARAKIVRKVMADKGCSMIEASKYVKEHNLYKK